MGMELHVAPSAKGAKECQRPAGASLDRRWDGSLDRARRPQGGRSQKGKIKFKVNSWSKVNRAST